MSLDLSLTAAAQAIRDKRVSSEELTRAALARARELQPRFNAFVRFDDEEAIAQARACDVELASGRSRGPLHGVPLAHKDMFYRRGKVSTCGSKLRAGWSPTPPRPSFKSSTQPARCRSAPST